MRRTLLLIAISFVAKAVSAASTDTVTSSTTAASTVRTSSATASSSAASVPEEPDQVNHDEAEEEQGVIPRSALYLSTQTITPVSQYDEKQPYDQALDELEQAKALWQKGDVEATSDMALQAYEDLLTIHGGRGKKNAKKRAKLRAQRYQAATLYIDASIAYIKDYVRKNSKASWAVDEGKGRLEDLRDVARDYEDLNHRLNKAIDELPSIKTSQNGSKKQVVVAIRKKKRR